MKIPNIDGTYQTKDKRITISVSRKEIELEIKESAQTVHIIDDDAPKKGTGDKMDNVMNVVNKTSKILFGS